MPKPKSKYRLKHYCKSKPFMIGYQFTIRLYTVLALHGAIGVLVSVCAYGDRKFDSPNGEW